MARKDRNVQQRDLRANNLVIVCEGTTTEYNYFQELAEYVLVNKLSSFSGIKVLPTPEENIISKNSNKRVKRNFVGGNAKEFRYYTKKESSQQLYDKFKGQPTRYLREAQLYLLEDGYNEGWAVYDKDHHSDHEGAMQLLESTPNLHVAFSAYSFEEWLLVHFERNGLAYNHSDCCNPKDKKSNPSCMGENCIGGRLRTKNYISNFSKTGTGYFQKYTLREDGTLNPLPLINAVWTRSIHMDNNRFTCNPYTDVDVLVKKLLNCVEDYKWGHWNQLIQLAGTTLNVTKEGNVVHVENCGDIAYVMTMANWNYCDVNGMKKCSVLSSTCILHKNDSLTFEIMSEYPLLLIKDSGCSIYFSIED